MSQSTPETTDPALGKALGRIPSGVYILTTVHGGRPEVMLASWVQQAGFHPPAVSVAVAKERPIRQALLAARRFALAVVPQDDTSLMKKYGRGVPPGADPFEGVEVITTPAGLPVPASALAWLECELTEAFDFGGDHEIHVARVTAGQVLREGKSFSHQRGSGFHY
jgi:3-hydroxy-9,10-secoandrosta-1,3,5(10)-triene-9,17-dione monooxygenase reductase component